MATEPDLTAQRGHRSAMRRGNERSVAYQTRRFGDQGGVVASNRYHTRMPTPNPHTDTATTQSDHIAGLGCCDRRAQETASGQPG